MTFHEENRDRSHQEDDLTRVEGTPFPEEEGPHSSGGSFFLEIIKFAVIAFLIVAPIRLFIAQPFIVSGASMQPTFENGDYLIVDQLSYRFAEPERGDVIVFRLPQAGGRFLIKRIVGLPGETISIRGSKVFAESQGSDTPREIDEWYVAQENLQYENLTLTLGEDEYFVMGDNRNESSDSRAWGPLHEEHIAGEALVRLLPVTHVGLYPGTSE